MKKLIASIILSVAISATCLAGDVQTPGFQADPAPPPTLSPGEIASVPTQGDIPTDGWTSSIVVDLLLSFI